MYVRSWIPVVVLCVGSTCLIACWQSVHVADSGDQLPPASPDGNADDVDPRALEIDNPGHLPTPSTTSGSPSADSQLEAQWRASMMPVGSLATESLSDAGDGWLSLVEADWRLGAGRETHICARITVKQSVYLHEFSPVIPLGTHHTGLSVWPAGSAPDGVVECGPEVSGRQIFGSGIATKPYTLPDGVAMQIAAGDQLLLNLHLYNTSDKELVGRSGVRARSMPAQAVKQVAEMTLGGPLSLTIPHGRSTQTGQCTFGHATTLFSVAPHMHQLGVRMKVVAERKSAGNVVLFDEEYSFESQQRYAVDFLQLQAGDVVHVECTYENTTPRTVPWGQSSNDEMCFVGLMGFPAMGGSYLCTS